MLIDKDDEIVDLRDCENCKQKDQRIAELETEIERHSKYFIALNEEVRNEYDYAEQLKQSVPLSEGVMNSYTYSL